MSDDPFAAFKEGQPPAQEAAPDSPKPKNGRKKKKEVEAAPPPKKARKPRQVRQFMVPLGILPLVSNLSEDEAKHLIAHIDNMQGVPKKSRIRIVAALAKIFS